MISLIEHVAFEREGIIPKSYRVLIADDEFLIRWSLDQALTQEGHRVIAVENGKKAVDEMKFQHFDFIITDLIMPEMDGWKLLEVARRSDPSSRVIIITAHGKDDTKKIATEKGAWAYLEKPYIIDKVKGILKETSIAAPPHRTGQ